MRVALDATHSLGDRLTGVGVYSREILHGLARDPSLETVWCYRPHRFFRSFRDTLAPRARRRPLFQSGFGLPRCDLFHGLNQRLPHSLSHIPAVVTFHDLFVLTGEYSTPEFRARFAAQARDAAARAFCVIAVSRFTGDQVRDLLHVEPSRIHVVHHGVRAPAPPAAAVTRQPLILSVGAIQKRKNTLRLVEAFERTRPGWRLVLAGSCDGFEAQPVLERIARSPRRADIEITGWVGDAVLDDLYASASVFAFPSLDEGFGMPVLDAMSRGVAVVTSNCSALPEVAGDAAMLVDPLDTDSIAHGLSLLMDDTGCREDLARRGLSRCQAFSWEKAVSETSDVYRRTI
ncbi:MAG: glycosyltransferase family 1 protein [Bryobacteraceae bacterium]